MEANHGRSFVILCTRPSAKCSVENLLISCIRVKLARHGTMRDKCYTGKPGVQASLTQSDSSKTRLRRENIKRGALSESSQTRRDPVSILFRADWAKVTAVDTLNARRVRRIALNKHTWSVHSILCTWHCWLWTENYRNMKSHQLFFK